jgi:Concanavalin A-like lectin/glucanases superfamily/Peptide-N-glycosidase F, C terminal/Secretion system C-terminal sorting domain
MLRSTQFIFIAAHCLLCILLCTTQATAQDTLIVQTITLDSDLRSGVFSFPNDPNQTYEKILMRYQMRCHDAAVGNGNVGCREWDYSCNTFITDSTRVDSIRALHPNYIVSNFSGSEFAYTLQPVYNYTQYEQKEVVYNNVITETTAPVGIGAMPLTLAGTQTVGRAQFLFTAAELTTAGLVAGPISSLRMDVTELGSAINFLSIKMKHSSKTELDAADPDLSGFTEVYFLSTAFANTGEQPLLFYDNFEWDGSSNILVEFSFTNQNTGMPTTVNSHDAGFSSSIFTGAADYALLFNGSGYIPLDPTPLSVVNNALTVSFWAKGSEAILPTNTTVFEGQDAGGNRQANVHLPWSNGEIYWDCGNTGGTYDRINGPANANQYEGNWSHWAFTKNVSTGTMSIFHNGQLFFSGTGKTRPIALSSFNFARDISGNNFYYGAIDELQIWNAALSQSTIQEWMRQSITPAHPNYNNLLAYFPLDEGSSNQLSDISPNNTTATVDGSANWQRIRGKDLFKNFVTSSLRPNITFVQGTYEQEINSIFVLDSVLAPQHQVKVFEVVGTDLVQTNTFLAFPAGAQYVLNESGQVVDTIQVFAEDMLSISNLEYFNKFPAKYEILSLVTPYGNGLDLGQNGKTFTFDVTDYGPILKGNRRLSVELGGEFQEELDISFLYISGTPPRDVIDIQNIWPFQRGWFASILNDDVFEPRQLSLLPFASAYEIRSSITGHGQNGEFVQRTHYLNVNGGSNEFTYPVWQTCGNIPIYPQGGTWLFDRAGWCPGNPTTVNRFDITPYVSAGATVAIDYGLLGANMNEANYLVSNQLVTYGAANYSNDAALLDVIRPSLKVEHQRFNPACNFPTILIQNTGSNNLTSLNISYQVEGGTALNYQWTGDLAFLETEEVDLPVEALNFWENGTSPKVFIVTILEPNGAADQYLPNNTLRSAYVNAAVLDHDQLLLNYKTNNRAEENTMYLRDYSGSIVLQRIVMADVTEYTDALDLPSGCYTLEFLDTGGDGLDYWYWNQTGQGVGTGYLRIRRQLPSGNFMTVRTFEPEFGSFINFDFIIPQTVSTLEPGDKPTWLSVFPNPATDLIYVDLIGFEQEDVLVSLYNTLGQRLDEKIITNNLQQQAQVIFEAADLPAGVYQIVVEAGTKLRSAQVVVN